MSATKTRVLVIDDDPEVSAFIADALDQGSYSVETARDSPEGLRRARDFAPDVLLLDLLMPDMHGFDICQILRQSEWFRGKILIVSGKTFEADKRAARRLGADGFLSKPFTAGDLLAAIRGLGES